MNSENQNIEITKAQKKPKQHPVAELFDYLEIFIFAACVVLLVFTFSIRLCRVDGNSMYDTLIDREMLLVSDVFYTPESGDVIVFHQSNNANERLNKPLVKRVIAAENQYLRIVYTSLPCTDDPSLYYIRMDIWVSDDESFDDTEKLNEDFIDFEAISRKGTKETVFFTLGDYIADCKYESDGTFVYESKIPEGYLFVVGDNRYNSNDSRLEVGLVDERCVLGKVLLRLNPLGKVD